MANKLRQNDNIKGIRINEIEYLISQFADDTDLYLNFDHETINETFHVLQSIEANTGLRISYDKTTVYQIGSIVNTNAKVYTTHKIKWSNDYINTLGIDLYNSTRKRNVNFESIIAKLKTVSNMWYYLKMTLMGKIIVVNSLMASLFVYKMQVLPLIDDEQISLIESIIEDFVWDGKRPKINVSVLKRNKEDGGLRLVDIKTKHRSLLCNWVVDTNSNLQIANLARYFLSDMAMQDWIWKLNINKTDSRKVFGGSNFWGSVANEWHEYTYEEPVNYEKVANQCIWCNSYMKINGEMLNLDKWKRKGVYQIKQLCNNNKFLPYSEFKDMYHVECSWLEYHSIINCIPKRWKMLLSTGAIEDGEVPQCKFDELLEYTKVSRLVYHDMLKTDLVLSKLVKTWNTKTCGLVTIDDMRKYVSDVCKISNVTKLCNFQYRLLHNKIFCNDILFHWKKVDTVLCNLCTEEKQLIRHLMCDCKYTRDLLEWFKNLLRQCDTEVDSQICFQSIIYNNIMENPTNVFNLILLVLKQYIYRCKCQNTTPNRYELWCEIKLCYDVEMYNASRVGRLEKVKRKWNPVSSIFESTM